MNKIITIDILKDLENYLKMNLNDEIEKYNTDFGTNLKKINNITYKGVDFNLPEVFIGISKTNFEYSDISSDNNLIINECYIIFTDKDNDIEFQDNMERYIYILYKLLTNLTSENILLIIIKNIERDEVQAKDLQIIKSFIINFDIKTIL